MFHHFHQCWIGSLCDRLNAGLLPPKSFALIERTSDFTPFDPSLAEPDLYALRADRVAIRHRLGGVIAVIEVVSPGNKSSKAALRAFVDRAVAFLRQGVHLLIIDLFPPTPRDPEGFHKAIWDDILEEPFTLPPNRPLTLASYSAGDLKVACVEPVAVGDPLPDMPLFIEPERYVPAPLKATYQLTWDACPAPFREAVLADAATYSSFVVPKG